MKMTFRWYGESDPVTLEKIRQIPGVDGIVTAIYDIPVGEVWSYDRIVQLKNTVEASGLELSVIESVPVHEDIKMGCGMPAHTLARVQDGTLDPALVRQSARRVLELCLRLA